MRIKYIHDHCRGFGKTNLSTLGIFWRTQFWNYTERTTKPRRYIIYLCRQIARDLPVSDFFGRKWPAMLKSHSIKVQNIFMILLTIYFFNWEFGDCFISGVSNESDVRACRIRFDSLPFDKMTLPVSFRCCDLLIIEQSSELASERKSKIRRIFNNDSKGFKRIFKGEESTL